MDNFKRIARFEIVSFDQFKNSFEDKNDDEIKKIYESLSIPKRATKGSAGYDFYAPFDICLAPGQTIKIPTGIRVYMEENYVLKLYPRSGLVFKYRLQLNNKVGIIDSDYYENEDNDGHFMFAYYNFFDHDVEIKKGDPIGQLIFMKYLTADNDNAQGERKGGFGSTGR